MKCHIVDACARRHWCSHATVRARLVKCKMHRHRLPMPSCLIEAWHIWVTPVCTPSVLGVLAAGGCFRGFVAGVVGCFLARAFLPLPFCVCTQLGSHQNIRGRSLHMLASQVGERCIPMLEFNACAVSIGRQCRLRSKVQPECF